MIRFTSTLQCREAMHAGPRTTEFLVCAFPQFLCCVSLFLSSMYEVKKPLLLSSMRYTTFFVTYELRNGLVSCDVRLSVYVDYRAQCENM